MPKRDGQWRHEALADARRWRSVAAMIRCLSRLPGLVAAALALLSCSAPAASLEDLAARAVADAKAMPAGLPRDEVLREVSRNLRHADRAAAIEAARAMSDDYELRSFDPGPDKVLEPFLRGLREQASEADGCETFILGRKPGQRVSADVEQRIRNCFFMDAPPGIVAPTLPPFHIILAAAESLPPGRTKAQLLYMATWDSIARRPPGGARDAVQRLRALLPQLDPEVRKEATGWLETTSVDLIEDQPDRAIERVRAAFRRPVDPDAALFDEPATQASGLIGDFLFANDIGRAVEVTTLLPSSNDCWMVDDGFTGVVSFVLPVVRDEAAVGAYLDRLTETGTLSRLCPRGVHPEHATDMWLRAGREAKALEVAAASGDPALLGTIRRSVADRRLGRGDVAGARAVILSAAAVPPPLDAGDTFRRQAAAGARIILIHQLARIGDVSAAERLAAAYPGPGWRGFARSVIVATTGRERAGPRWAGPSLHLSNVPPES